MRQIVTEIKGGLRGINGSKKRPKLAARPPQAAVDDHAWVIGGEYFIRTVTHHYTGRLVSVHPQELLLVDAAWIPDDGRFTQAVATGDFTEVEPYPDGRMVCIGRSSILDGTIIPQLPRKQKPS